VGENVGFFRNQQKTPDFIDFVADILSAMMEIPTNFSLAAPMHANLRSVSEFLFSSRRAARLIPESRLLYRPAARFLPERFLSKAAMSTTIHDLLRAADDADAKRFPLIHPRELELWCSFPAWTVAQAAALSIMRDPNVISPEIIENQDLILHPHGVSKEEEVLRISRIGGIYSDRHRALLLAARYRELPAVPVDGSFEIRPLGFLAWEKTRRGQGPWSGLTDALVERVKAYQRGDADTGFAVHSEKETTAPATAAESPAGTFAPASTNPPADGAVGPQEGPLGVKGKDASLNWLSALMSEFPKSPPPEFKTKPDLEEYVRDTFEITQSEFRKVFVLAKAKSNADWYKRGHKSKN
jgi:hypothetical protein